MEIMEGGFLELNGRNARRCSIAPLCLELSDDGLCRSGPRELRADTGDPQRSWEHFFGREVYL